MMADLIRRRLGVGQSTARPGTSGTTAEISLVPTKPAENRAGTSGTSGTTENSNSGGHPVVLSPLLTPDPAYRANELKNAGSSGSTGSSAENRHSWWNQTQDTTGSTGSTAGLPAEWREALARIEAHPCPRSIPAERWDQAVVDARYLLTDWGHALYVTGWELADLFSAHRAKPLERYDGMGLALLLQGRKVGPILDDRIVIGHQSLRRFHAAPAETVMLWELA